MQKKLFFSPASASDGKIGAMIFNTRFSFIFLFSTLIYCCSFGQNFVDVATAKGISNYYGDTYGGGGISCVDFNKDGYNDLTFGTDVGREPLFYVNNSGLNFTQITLPISNLSRQTQILWVDIDNDDDYDLYIAANLAQNKLYVNDGNFNFTDITATSGLLQQNDDTVGTIFGDVDNDGDLDIYVSNQFYFGSKLYRNNGNNTFTDITATTGINQLPSLNFCAVFWDYDRDGDLDLYKINDKIHKNEMYRNDGGFNFTDVGTAMGTDVRLDAMGSAVGDMNNDGLSDLYIPNSNAVTAAGNTTPHNVLLKNNYPGSFQSIETTSGTDYSRWCWGASWADYDNDGWQDLYVSNMGLPTITKDNILYFNNGDETFTAQSPANMLNDNTSTFSCSTTDINNDGMMDIIVGPSGFDNFNVWENKIANGNNYLQLELEGTTSNKDGIGCWIDVYAGSDVYTRFTHCGIGYLSQESNKNHIGIGTHSTISSIKVTWPSGIIDIIPSPSINNCLTLIEGSNQVRINNNPAAPLTTTTNPSHSVARNWMELLLQSIRLDFARPTVHARNLYHSSIVMFDAWAAYQNVSVPFLLGRTVDGYTCPYSGIPVSANVANDRDEAISFAMYRLLKHRFQTSPAYASMFDQYDLYMSILGYNVSNTSVNYTSGDPAALGNYLAQQIINFGLQDGSNEQNGYANSYYQPVNTSMVMDYPGNPNLTDFNRWQPLTLDIFIDQSGNQIPINTPDFLSPEWGSVSSFALFPNALSTYQRNGNDYEVYYDPGAPPYIDPVTGGGTSSMYKWGFSLVSVWSSHLDQNNNTMLDISPASIGNIQSYPTNFADYPTFYDLINGGDASIGHAVNPKTGMPYTPQLVKRADYARVLAEFWADGPDSETPPGHWFTLLNHVSDHPAFKKKYQGNNGVLNDLEWDVKAYFSLGGAMHDAAISAWGIKGWYDYIRPVSAIRGMAELGQSTDATLPSYHAGGLSLIPGYIELVNIGDPLAGTSNQHVGKIKLYAWQGPDYISNPATDEAGVDWILAEEWWPYQRPSFVTPPFAGYVSGHSTFSRAAAEVMTMLTGDEFFPGGMGEFQADQNQFLVFEEGPSTDVILQWATYRDASDQCSLSRIWGGIHPPADDIPGRLIGKQIGIQAFNLAEKYIDGSICLNSTLVEDRNPIPNPLYQADQIISHGKVIAPDVNFEGVNYIDLGPDFEVLLGTEFGAYMIGCQ